MLGPKALQSNVPFSLDFPGSLNDTTRRPCRPANRSTREGFPVHALTVPKDQNAQFMFVRSAFGINRKVSARCRILWIMIRVAHIPSTGYPQIVSLDRARTALSAAPSWVLIRRSLPWINEYQRSSILNHRDSFPRFSVRSAWRGGAGHREPWATPPAPLAEPPPSTRFGEAAFGRAAEPAKGDRAASGSLDDASHRLRRPSCPPPPGPAPWPAPCPPPARPLPAPPGPPMGPADRRRDL